MNEYKMFSIVLIVLAIGILIGSFITYNSSAIVVIGEMVCEEKGYGDFVGFDSENKIIECKKTTELEKYNGGYIRVIE